MGVTTSVKPIVIARKILKTLVKDGYFDRADGNWDIFSKSFTWFSTCKVLSDDTQAQVERLWKARAAASDNTKK